MEEIPFALAALGFQGPCPTWQAPEVTGLGRLPMRAPLVPFADRAAALGGDVESSPYRIALDGRWRFLLVEKPAAAPREFVLPAFDDSGFDEIEVPTSWALQGFGRPAYTNVLMPFAEEPPAVPEANPTGLFRRRFTLPEAWHGRRTLLRVGSAESVVYVWLNGVPIGFGKDSRLASEFDLTAHLVDGENTLALAVVQWSDATWLEDQDQWWLAGLHRSLELVSTAPTFVADLALRATPGAAAGAGRFSAEVAIGFSSVPEAGHRIDIELFDSRARRMGAALGVEVPVFRRGSEMIELVSGYLFPGHVARADFEVEGIRAWNHEEPVLYRALVTLRDPTGAALEVVSQRVGFRSLEIRDNQLLVNGAPVSIVGVNRHEWDERRGRAVGLDGMRRDVELMKRHHVNAVRCSHYPPDPRFLDLCDEAGLYVIDEANLETHARWSSLCHDPRWLGAMLERGARMVLRDRNHACVIAWSLGNESGYGAAHDAMAAWIRRVDPTRPLHYEGAVNRDLHAEAPVTDIVCPMYAEIADIVAWSRSGRDRRRPLILCEYSHAMGNSNGSLADYFAAFESERGLQGGFVWEWVEHGIRVEAGGGRVHHAYGGDFGEKVHDSNFCCDGLVSADRRPHPALAELGFLAQPVRVRVVDAARGEFEIENRRWFTGLEDLALRWAVEVDGFAVERGSLALPEVPPRSRRPLRIRFRRPRLASGEEAVLDLRFTLRRGSAFAPRGFEVAFAQVPLPIASVASRSRPASVRAGAVAKGAVARIRNASPPAPLVVEERGLALSVRGEATELVVDRAAGRVDHLAHGKNALLVSGPEACFWRAPTDNDGLKQGWMKGLRALGDWWRAGLDRLERKPISFGWRTQRDGCVVLRMETVLVGADPAVAALHREDLVVHPSGRIDAKESFETPPEWKDLPRVGVVMTLAARFERLEWLGLGPHETYPDRRASGRFGRFRSTVTDEFVPYAVPQEHGHHHRTRWLALAADDGAGVLVTAAEPFGFSVSHHRVDDLAAALHPTELVARTESFLHLDAAHRGLGTASCGPDVLPRYRIRPGRHRLVWSLVPYRAGRDDPGRLARETSHPGRR